MTSTTIVCPLNEVRNELVPLLQREFSISSTIAEGIFDYRLNPHFVRFKPTVHFVIECPYVDRFYRDSYYTYYSTKLGNYKKDCIRLSFFENAITGDEFRDPAAIAMLQSRYLGFMVLRPTVPGIIGRSVISPAILIQNHFLAVTSSFQATVCAVKFEANGFPHSSQDAEMISCAETSIWAIMEYFSSKYANYKPALPSTIITALQSRSNDRQVPSSGLNVDQVGFALREFGFGTKIYSKKHFLDPDFKRLISCYIESGLPLVILMDNFHKSGSIGHAVLAIGHSRTEDQQIDNLPATVETNPFIINLLGRRKAQMFDNDDITRDFVFIDDNQPAYQLAPLNTPARHYNKPDWDLCEVSYFIVPLYPKIYLEAYEAKIHIKILLLQENFTIIPGSDLFIRVFLTSSRSYKDYLVQHSGLHPDVRDTILDTPMPKFIWIGEVSDKQLIKQKQANGVFILDATEPNLENYNALIFGGYNDRFYQPDPNSKVLIENLLPLGSFNIYINNLKGF